MTTKLLMPKATAVWLVDNTSLTFPQIAAFCSLHELEVKGIADGDVAQGIKGMDPVSSGQLTRDELARAQEDTSYKLQLLVSKTVIPEIKTKRGPRYTPLSRRQDRPDAISWLLRNHSELTDGQVGKLVGTTKPTIQAIRDRTHWNATNIKPVDPVTLSLCSQAELDSAVEKAAKRLAKDRAKLEKEGTLMPASESVTADTTPAPAPVDPGYAPIVAAPKPADEAPAPALDAESVFANLKGTSTDE